MTNARGVKGDRGTRTEEMKMATVNISQSPWQLHLARQRSYSTECSEDLLTDRTFTARFQVKCRNCGAFGHKANSVRCPMKRWGGALAPQLLGPKEMKENRKPRTPQERTAAEAPKSATRETEPRSRDEEQERQALLQRFPRRPPRTPQRLFKDQTEPCDYVRRPTRPTPVYTTQRKCVADPSLTSGSPTRNLDTTTQDIQYQAAHSSGQDSKLSVQALSRRATQTSTQNSQSPPKNPRLSPCLSPQKHSQKPGVGFSPTVCPPAHPSAVRPVGKHQGPSLNPAQGRRPGPPLHKGSLLRTVPACHGPQVTLNPHVPGQPLRMVFMRSERGLWSSRFITAPSVPPAGNPAPPGHSLPVPDEAEGPCTQVPLSILREDLWVSSSEESDGH
ncbi:protein FAM90A3-like [Rhynchonycteris naso]